MDKKESVKRQIGKAAKECFLKYGLEKTTLDDIARVMGLNKSSLFYYYKNKEALFLDVAVTEGEEYLKSLQEKTLKKKSTEAMVLFYIGERYNYYNAVLNLNRITPETLHKLVPGFLKLYESVMQKEIEFLASLLKEGIRTKQIFKSDPTKLATSLIIMSDSIKHYTEQRAVLEKANQVDYAKGLDEIKFLLKLIFRT
jgi:AcrR family transcriptional regulator